MPRLSKNFHTVEFECRCGCGLGESVGDISEELVSGLQKLRDMLGICLYVNSGLRCEEHNRNVGGSIGSQHMLGRAADVWCRQFDAMLLYAFQIPEFIHGGIGVYGKSGFLHLDTRGHTARWYEQ